MGVLVCLLGLLGRILDLFFTFTKKARWGFLAGRAGGGFLQQILVIVCSCCS